MAVKPQERIDHDPYASRRQPQQGERVRQERASARPAPRDDRAAAREPRPEAPRRPAADPADGLMQGGD